MGEEMDDIKFFTELTKMLDEAKGELTGEEAFQAEMFLWRFTYFI